MSLSLHEGLMLALLLFVPSRTNQREIIRKGDLMIPLVIDYRQQCCLYPSETDRFRDPLSRQPIYLPAVAISH